MAVQTSWFCTEASEGVDLNTTQPAINLTTNPETPGLPQNLGTVREGSANSLWVLVQASTTITQFNLVVIDDSFKANNFTTASALANPAYQMGLAEFAQSSADPGSNPVFWCAIRGTGMQVNVSGSAGTGVTVNNGTTPGMVSISATGTNLAGIVLYASAGASAAVECAINFPRLKNFGG